jgi:uncharacterized protein YqgC (DUF456 family)
VILTIVFSIIAFLFILIGLAGVILPFIPGGVPVAWLGLFIYAIGTGFQRISVLTIVVFFIIMLLTIIIDFFAPLMVPGRYRASKWGLLGATVGSLLGFLLLRTWGIVLGPVVGAVAGELAGRRPPGEALRVGVGTIVGLIIGMMVKVTIVLVMLGWLIASWF